MIADRYITNTCTISEVLDLKKKKDYFDYF